MVTGMLQFCRAGRNWSKFMSVRSVHDSVSLWSRSESVLDRPPNPSVVRLKLPRTVAKSARSTLAWAVAAQPPSSSYPETRSSSTHSATSRSGTGSSPTCRTPITMLFTELSDGVPLMCSRVPSGDEGVGTRTAPSSSTLLNSESRGALFASRATLSWLSADTVTFISFSSGHSSSRVSLPSGKSPAVSGCSYS